MKQNNQNTMATATRTVNNIAAGERVNEWKVERKKEEERRRAREMLLYFIFQCCVNAVKHDNFVLELNIDRTAEVVCGLL